MARPRGRYWRRVHVYALVMCVSVCAIGVGGTHTTHVPQEGSWREGVAGAFAPHLGIAAQRGATADAGFGGHPGGGSTGNGGVGPSARRLASSTPVVTLTVGAAGANYTSIGAAAADPSVAQGPVRIVVAPGWYTAADGNCGLTLNATTAIVSSGGAAVTTVDCGHVARFAAFTLRASAPASVWGGVEGLTIQRGVAVGSGSHGGAVLVEGEAGATTFGAVRLRDLVIRNCHANASQASGGALAVVSASGVRIEGVTISQCSSSQHGGAIMVDSATNVTLSDVHASDCSAGAYGAGVYLTSCDGTTDTPSVALTHSSFTHCVGSASGTYGGGMSMWFCSHVAISNVTVAKSSARRGGGVVAWAVTDSTIRDVVIEDCTAGYSGTEATFGGGLYLADSNSVWHGLVLRRNNGGRGGAAYIRWSDASTLVASTIAGNTAGHEAGGVACTENAATTFRGCNVSSNVAPSGGGVYAQAVSQCSFTDSVVADNVASDFTGGAIAVVETATVSVAGGRLSGNSAEERGGGAFVGGSGRLVLTGAGTIVGNHAVAGGGLAASFSAVMSVSGSWQIKGNIANNGGGIWMSGTASLALNHANVTGNTALRIGGAITAEGRATAIASNGTRVSGNAAIEGGGAYLDSTGRWVFDGVSFVGNAAATSGGGLYLQVLANTTFTNCSWARNTAAVTGGAVHGGLSAGSSVSVSQALASVLPATTATLVATFHSCSFSNNAAGSRGGGLFVDLEHGWLLDTCIIFNNTAENGGGAYFEDADDMRLRRVAITDNKALDHGGGIAIDRAAVTCRGCQVTRNTAGVNGGGVWVGPAGVFHMLTMPGGGVGYTSALTANVAAVSGGGAYAQGVVRFAAPASPVTGGDARLWLSLTSNVATSGSGGGLMLQQKATQCAASSITNVSFVANRAARVGGGGMFSQWSSTAHLSSPSAVCQVSTAGSSFSSNVAAYGAAHGTAPARIWVVNVTASHASGLNDDSPSVRVLDPTVSSITPVDTLTVTIAIRDLLGAPVSGYPIQVGLSSLTPECRVTHPSSNIRAFPVDGKVVFEDLSVLANPGANCTISVYVTPTLGTLPKAVTLYVSVGTCPVGYEVLREPNGFGVLCHECSQGLYNINGDGFCRPCPSFGAWCSGGSEVLVTENLWAQPTADGNLTIERCPPLFCCTPGDDETFCHFSESCGAERSGYKCGTCAEGYTDVGGACTLCDGINWSASALLAVCAFAFTAFVVFVDLDSSSPFFLQVTFVTQVVPLVLSIDSVGDVIEGTVLSLNLQWPSVLRSWAELADERSCLFPMTPTQATGQLYVIPIAFIICISVIAFCHKLWASTCCARCHGCQHRCHASCCCVSPGGEEQPASKPRFTKKRYTRAGFRLVLASYSCVGDAALPTIVCVSRPESTEWASGLYMVAQPAVECYQGTHLWWALVGWVLTAVWVCGVPITIFVTLARARRRFRRRHPGMASPTAVIGKWTIHHHLHALYKDPFFWWMGPQLLRRSLLVLVRALLLNNPVSRHICDVVLLLGFLAVHVWFKPYKRDRFNFGEMYFLSLMIVGATTMIAREGIPTTERRSSSFAYIPVIQAIVLVLLVLWFVVFLVLEGVEKWKWAKRKVDVMRERVASGLRNASSSSVGKGWLWRSADNGDDDLALAATPTEARASLRNSKAGLGGHGVAKGAKAARSTDQARKSGRGDGVRRNGGAGGGRGAGAGITVEMNRLGGAVDVRNPIYDAAAADGTREPHAVTSTRKSNGAASAPVNV